MLDWDELPGSADAGAASDRGEEDDLAAMKALFLASEWADRRPLAVETDVETVLPTASGPISVRGRIDAVFPAANGGHTIVDWKTGDVGRDSDLAARAVQLGVYALAWQRIHGLAPGSVDVAFYFERGMPGRAATLDGPGDPGHAHEAHIREAWIVGADGSRTSVTAAEMHELTKDAGLQQKLVDHAIESGAGR